MAKSKFEYVKKFEQDHVCLPNTWMVMRLDGRSFHRFVEVHEFGKPNDDRALGLMNRCAQAVMREFSDIVLAYGQSDEYSFVFKRDTNLFTRRESKIVSTMTSFFAASFVFHWSAYFPSVSLLYPPTFDGRVVLYPSLKNIRDYLSWRQTDCHINNLYNNCFWKLVQSGLSTSDAERRLYGTVSSDKNELLFTEFGVNYNELPQMHRKGTIIIWNSSDKELHHPCGAESTEQEPTTGAAPPILAASEGFDTLEIPPPSSVVLPSGVSQMGPQTKTTRKVLLQLHDDIIGEAFWNHHSYILHE